MDVIAEGVETNMQLAQLRSLRCEAGQGYLFNRPLDTDAVAHLLAETAEHQPDDPDWDDSTFIRI